MGRPKVKGVCVHWWLVDACNVGRCQKCGEVKDFGRLLDVDRHKVSQKLVGSYIHRRGKGRKKKKRADSTPLLVP